MKKLSQWPWKNIGLIILALLVVGLLFVSPVTKNIIGPLDEQFMAYDNKVSPTSGMGGGLAMRSTTNMAMDASESIMPPEPQPDGIAPGVTDRQLIRTGNLSLIVADVEQTIEDIKQTVTTQWEGIIQETNINNLEDDSQRGWVRLRVPAERFDESMAGLKNMALDVESENTRVDDVTGQVTDTEARLKNLRAEEEQYLEILDRAETVEDTLQATDYLNRVRNEIEWAERSLKNVTERVAMSTINVDLIDEGDVEILGMYWTPWLNVKKAARGALENLMNSVDALVVILLNVPLVLIWGVLVLLIGLLGWKGLKKIGLL